MKINSVNPRSSFISQATNEKNESVLVRPQNVREDKNFLISFMANPLLNSFKRPNIKDPELKKVFLLAKKFPNNCEMKEVGFISLNNESFAYKIQKNGAGRTEVGIKNKVTSIKDWLKNFENQQAMDCVFDNRGMLISAKLVNNNSDNPSEILFIHTGREGRRIDIGETIYRPLVGETSTWGIVTNKKSRNIIGKENLAQKLEDNVFSQALFELGSNRASIAMLSKE